MPDQRTLCQSLGRCSTRKPPLTAPVGLASDICNEYQLRRRLKFEGGSDGPRVRGVPTDVQVSEHAPLVAVRRAAPPWKAFQLAKELGRKAHSSAPHRGVS